MRLLRQVLTESTVLSLMGGTAGIVLARVVHGLVRLVAAGLPRIEEVGFDVRVVGFAFVVSLVAGVLFGIPPGLSASAADPMRMLQGGAAVTARGVRSMSVFVVVQIAVTMVLLVAAALLLHSFLGLVTVDPGYRPSGVAMVRLGVDPDTLGETGWTGRPLDELLDRLATHPDVEAAGVVSVPPLPEALSLTGVQVDGVPPGRMLAVPQMTSPGYLHSIGLRLAEGRWLTVGDHATRAPVTVVNQTFVDRFVAPASALGRRLEVGTASLDIVGIVEDARLMGLNTSPRPEFFTSYHLASAVSGSGATDLTLVVRAQERASDVVPILRTLLPELHPDLPVEIEALQDRLSASVAQPRFYALLLGTFAGMALLLAAAGLYGTLSHSVARQTRAIGIRRALGAKRGAILRMFLGNGLLLVSLGLVFGVAGAIAASRTIRHLLVDTPAWDPLAYGAATLLLVAAGILASYVPARRATAVDPIEVLRCD
jgi:predicted permease